MTATTSARILVIDDESAIRNVLKKNLVANDFSVEEAGTGLEGLQKATEFHPHLIVLDLGLPDINGLEVLKRLRKWTEIPILILTVTDDHASKVALLDAGADDYLTKPFNVAELLARIRVGLRRNNLIEATPVFKSGDLEIDLNKHLVKVNSKTVKLTVTEFDLLSRLVRGQGKVVTQEQLLFDVWGHQGVGQIHYLRIYIGQLRKKLEADVVKPKHILNEPGVGYKII